MRSKPSWFSAITSRLARSWDATKTSLTTHVVRIAQGAVLIFGLLGAFGASTIVVEETRFVLDSALIDAAEIMDRVLEERGLSVQTPFKRTERLSPSDLRVEVLTAEGQLMSSTAGGNRPLLPANAPVGLSTVQTDHETYRAYKAPPHSAGWSVVVAEPESRRKQAQLQALVALLGFPLLALAALEFVLPLVLRRGLRPLSQFSASIAAREVEPPLAGQSSSAVALHQPLPLTGLPNELHPIATALNNLFAHLAESVERERRFAATVAHELRTPLAGLRAQLELAALDLSADAKAPLLRATAACDTLTAVIERLWLLARAEQGALRRERIALDRLLQAAVDELTPAAQDVQLALPSTQLQGDPELMGVLVRNLVDNAQSHGGGLKELACGQDAQGIWFSVGDYGLNKSQLNKLQVTRLAPPTLGNLSLHRLPPDHGREGLGIGLALSRRIAQLHGAQLQLQKNGERGTVVTVRFNAAEVIQRAGSLE